MRQTPSRKPGQHRDVYCTTAAPWHWGRCYGHGVGSVGFRHSLTHSPTHSLTHSLPSPPYILTPTFSLSPSLQDVFTPVKWFSIDRVFRNETLDATHLAEFHQIEGVVADTNLTLGDLMGILHEFFSKLGELWNTV